MISFVGEDDGIKNSRRRIHHQHELSGFFHQRSSKQIRLWDHQGCCHWSDQEFSCRFCLQKGITKEEGLFGNYIWLQIRVNAICPGTVETPSWHDRVNESENPEEAKKNFIARQALGRLGTAEEIAALVTYLASDEVN